METPTKSTFIKYCLDYKAREDFKHTRHCANMLDIDINTVMALDFINDILTTLTKPTIQIKEVENDQYRKKKKRSGK